jgi:hypothetical protein
VRGGDQFCCAQSNLECAAAPGAGIHAGPGAAENLPARPRRVHGKDSGRSWLAGQARNWELADYELTELKEVFSDVQDFVPRYQNVPVGDMIDAIITGTMTELDKAISARDFNAFSTAFDQLTTACNSCHQAANRPFITIRRPAQSSFSNQDFSPKK